MIKALALFSCQRFLFYQIILSELIHQILLCVLPRPLNSCLMFLEFVNMASRLNIIKLSYSASLAATLIIHQLLNPFAQSLNNGNTYSITGHFVKGGVFHSDGLYLVELLIGETL